MILLLDNYDSFSFILRDYLMQCGEQVILKENNDAFEEITALNFSKVLLSPGPKKPGQSGCLMNIVEYCVKHSIPTLGVCLGHQAIAEYFGGHLDYAIKPMHGKISTIRHFRDPIFQNIPDEFQACRYHSLVIKKIDNTPLNIIALSTENEIMALAHQSLPMWGVQFHPEAFLTQYGLLMIKNWLNNS